MAERRNLFLAHWVLRIGAAMCFLGHGAFGLITKKAWVAYFGVVGISEHAAYRLMPAVGALDIALGAAALLAPLRVLILYMTLWCVWTALLRPLAGESAWEAVERAGNYGVPLALLVLAGMPRTVRGWFARAEPADSSPGSVAAASIVLRVTTALLLIGHGALAAMVHKEVLARHFEAAGVRLLGLDPVDISWGAGWIEMLLGAAVLVWPARWLLLVVVAWKGLTELLYPLSGDYVWEFVERGGSYAAPLGLLLLRESEKRKAKSDK